MLSCLAGGIRIKDQTGTLIPTHCFFEDLDSFLANGAQVKYIYARFTVLQFGFGELFGDLGGVVMQDEPQ